MQVTVRVIELCGPLQLPEGLAEYDGVRFYCSVQNQIKGYVTIWNPYKANLVKEYNYPADFGSWLVLSSALFSPLGVQKYDEQTVKALFCTKLGIRLEEVQIPYTPILPSVPPNLTASIVVPTRDRPADLIEALTYLVNHKTQVLHEIVVVDNNPASGLTAPIVARFPEVIYVEERRAGEFYARNAGILAARGDIIVCTDDDVRVGEGWLDHLIAPFADPQVTSVMGLVLPYQLNTRAQVLFEEMGGLNLGYERQRFDTDFFRPKLKPDVSNNPPMETTAYGFAYFYKSKGVFPEFGRLGNTACSAFRYKVFADPRIGPFDVVLSSGAPARCGGDIYQFYRILAAGYVSIYQPQARAFHKHRTTMAGLRRQMINFECGHTARLVRIATHNKDMRALKALSYLPYYNWRRFRYVLSGKSSIPFSIMLIRIWGSWLGPINLWRALRYCRKRGYYKVEQYAAHFAQREGLHNPATIVANLALSKG